MNNEYYQKNIRSVEIQRNICLVLTLLSSCTVLLLAFFMFWRGEKVIVVPAVIEKEFWVDSNTFSTTYLEQMGVFLGKLILEKSPSSAQAQRQILLRHTDPAYFGTLTKKLIEEELLLAKQNASYVFFPVDIRVDLKKRSVLLIGDRTIYVSDKPVSTEREGYVLTFKSSGSKLLLEEITAFKEKNQ